MRHPNPLALSHEGSKFLGIHEGSKILEIHEGSKHLESCLLPNNIATT